MGASRISRAFVIAAAICAVGSAPAGRPRPSGSTRFAVAPFPAALDTARHVVHVSVDGLRADTPPRLGTAAPAFGRLRIEGAFTENARTDFDYTVTLPNHACELTSRPVLGYEGHGVSFNSDDPRTIAEVHGSYVAGVFDVAHDNGLRTACYASKMKFEIFDRSWNESNGAPDVTGIDDGRDKIDLYRYDSNTAALLEDFIGRLETQRWHYAFIHFSDPDGAGETYGWESIQYFDAVLRVDGFLGRILDLIESDPVLADHTWIVVTTDHGGVYASHGNASIRENYTIPLYLWGPGVAAGADLYALNPVTRADPGAGRPDHASVPQPVRNGESGNISLDILGLGAIPGSTFDAAQDLALAPSEGIPSVWIASPAPGSSFPYPSDVAVEAAADGGAEGVARVEFFVNGDLAAADATSPYEYVLSGAPIGSHRITARAVRADGLCAASSVVFEISSTADACPLNSPLVMPPRVYPNPSDGRTTVSFELAKSGDIAIELYDPLGRRVGTIWRGRLEEGTHEFPFDAGAYPPGLYFYRIATAAGAQGGKIMIVR